MSSHRVAPMAHCAPCSQNSSLVASQPEPWPPPRLMSLAQHLHTTQLLGLPKTVRPWFTPPESRHSNRKRCLLAMDMENAFNQIDRSCFVREVRCARAGKMLWALLLEQQLRLVWPRTNAEQERSATRRSHRTPLCLWPPQTQRSAPWPSPAGALWTWWPFPSTTELRVAPARPRKPSSQSSRKAWARRSASESCPCPFLPPYTRPKL